MKTFDVITIGTGTRDVFLQMHDVKTVSIPRGDGKGFLFPIGAKTDVPTVIFSTGGGATNAAATFANFGFRVAFLGKLGTDDNGDAVLYDLRKRGVETRFVKRDTRQPTAFSVILTVRCFSTLFLQLSVCLFQSFSLCVI